MYHPNQTLSNSQHSHLHSQTVHLRMQSSWTTASSPVPGASPSELSSTGYSHNYHHLFRPLSFPSPRYPQQQSLSPSNFSSTDSPRFLKGSGSSGAHKRTPRPGSKAEQQKEAKRAARDRLRMDEFMTHHLNPASDDPENKYDFVLLRGVANARNGMKTAPPNTIPCKYGRRCFRKDCRFSHTMHPHQMFVEGQGVFFTDPGYESSPSSKPSSGDLSSADSIPNSPSSDGWGSAAGSDLGERNYQLC